MDDGFEYGIRYADTAPGEALGPFPTSQVLYRWLRDDNDRILARRPAGSDDAWREVHR
jgi:hypothetical protein